jgi:DNA polymerase III subunit delta'
VAFQDFPEQQQGVQLLQRAMERGRLAHGYLFSGNQLEELEGLARALAKTLNCRNPLRGIGGVALDSCDKCLTCSKIENHNHPDVHWVRPESKTRVILIDQIRELMRDINLKPSEAEYKVAVIVGADRLNTQAANAFLKTLEEPPSKSILILLTTDPQRILETILSRCLRLSFSGQAEFRLTARQREWLAAFAAQAAAPQKSLLGRYRLIDQLLQQLSRLKTATEETLAARSPLQQYEDTEKSLKEKWESELSAAVEAEYRRQRSDLLAILQAWLRDIWVRTLAKDPAFGSDAPPDKGVASQGLLNFPEVQGGDAIAGRLTSGQARENLQILEHLQRLLATNVQEALSLEVCLLKLHL